MTKLEDVASSSFLLLVPAFCKPTGELFTQLRLLLERYLAEHVNEPALSILPPGIESLPPKLMDIVSSHIREQMPEETLKWVKSQFPDEPNGAVDVLYGDLCQQLKEQYVGADILSEFCQTAVFTLRPSPNGIQ